MCCKGLKILHTPWDPRIHNATHYAPTFMELRLEHGELIQWPTNSPFGAYQIWLVAWTMSSLTFSMVCGQAHFHGERDAIRAAFSDQVYSSHDDYHIDLINQIPVNYGYYLEQAHYSGIVSTDLICHHKSSRGASRNIKTIQMTWNPGKVNLSVPTEASAWGQDEFQGGRDVRTLPCVPNVRLPSHAGIDGPSPASTCRYIYKGRCNRGGHPEDHDNGTAAEPSLPPPALNLFSSCFFHFSTFVLVSSLYSDPLSESQCGC